MPTVTNQMIVIFRCEQDKQDCSLPKCTLSTSLVLMCNTVLPSSTKPTILENKDQTCSLLLSCVIFQAPGRMLYALAGLNRYCQPSHTMYFVPELQEDKLLLFDFTETASKICEFFFFLMRQRDLLKVTFSGIRLL